MRRRHIRPSYRARLQLQRGNKPTGHGLKRQSLEEIQLVQQVQPDLLQEEYTVVGYACDRIVFYLHVVFFNKRNKVISEFQSFNFMTTQSILLNQTDTETEAF